MKSVLIRFNDKNYYVKYEDLLNKANNKFFAYEDKELEIPAKYSGETLILNKSDIEKELKKSIKMPSRMPSNLATENSQEKTMTTEEKLRKYIRECILTALKEDYHLSEDDPYGLPDEDKYLFKTDDNYLSGISSESVNEDGEQPSAEELAAKEKAAKEKADKVAYQRFFSLALAKFGFSSVASIPDAKKREFFDYIDSNWTAKHEQPVSEYSGPGRGNLPQESDSYELKPNHKQHFSYIIKKLKDTNTLISAQNGVINLIPGTNLSKYLTANDIQMLDKINNEITETSSTGGVAGYETPGAFTGQKGISKKQKKIANQLGYELVDKSYAVKDQGDTQDLQEGKLNEASFDSKEEFIQYLEDTLIPDLRAGGSDATADDFEEAIFWLKELGESTLNEGLDTLYLRDEKLTNEQKFGIAMRQVRNNLTEIESLIQKSVRLKQEQGLDSNKVGKRAYSALKKINEKVIKMMVALNDLK